MRGRQADVYAELRTMIVRGALAPGTPLMARPLAEQLGVGRASLQVALRRLEQEGFVRFSIAGVYARASVTPLTVAGMEEIYTLIALLNGAAARAAAQLAAKHRQRIAAEMASLNARLARLLKSSSAHLDAIYDIDHQLHLCYIGAAAGPRIRGLYEAISSQGERYGRAYAGVVGHTPLARGPAATSPAEHEAIIEAIRDGDPDAAERAAVANWRKAADRLRRLIVAAGERGSF